MFSPAAARVVSYGRACDLAVRSRLRGGISTFFFFNDTATTEIYTLSLHDALPISGSSPPTTPSRGARWRKPSRPERRDRKSTRLNSSHSQISYAVFCLKKKNSTVILGLRRFNLICERDVGTALLRPDIVLRVIVSR